MMASIRRKMKSNEIMKRYERIGQRHIFDKTKLKTSRSVEHNTGWHKKCSWEKKRTNRKNLRGVGRGVGRLVGSGVGCGVGATVGSDVGLGVGTGVGRGLGGIVGTGDVPARQPQGSLIASARSCAPPHSGAVNSPSIPCFWTSKHCWPAMNPLTVACIPFRHNTQNTVSGPGDGAAVAGCATGAGVGSPGQPQVSTANACAIAHCSFVNPSIEPICKPAFWPCRHVITMLSKNASLASGLVSVKSPGAASRQMLHNGLGASVGAAVGLAVGAAVGT